MHKSEDVIKKINPLITVILCVFNQKKYLKKAFHGIASQTYKNIELIIADNGSTDGSKELIEEFSSEYPVKMVIHNNVNGNICEITNRAIKISSGEFIALIAGDDYYQDSYIEKNINKFSNLSADYGVVYSPYISVDEVSGRHEKTRTFQKSGYIFDELIQAQNKRFISAFTPVVRKSVFNDFQFDESLYCEGESIFMRIASKYKFMYFEEYLYYANKGVQNQGLNYKENTNFFLESNLRIIEKFPEKKYLVDKALSKLFLTRAWIAMLVLIDKPWCKECLDKVLFFNFYNVMHPRFIVLFFISFVPQQVLNKLIGLTGRSRKFINQTYRK